MTESDKRRSQMMAALRQSIVVAIIRSKDTAQIVKAAAALIEGGVTSIEVTMNTPGALNHIKTLVLQKNKGIQIGAGTVTSAELASKAIEAGAQFIVTPFSRKDIIDTAHLYGIPVLSGAFTPGEIAQAFEWGADVVKVFPAEMFGPSYIRAVRAPLDQIPLMPTGGVSADNAGEWLKAGAVMLGVGSSLYNKKLVEDGRFEKLTENAREFMKVVKNHR